MNVASILLLFPVAGFLFACADEVVTVVYTETYHAAAPIMRIYTVGLVTAAFATGNVLSLVDRGRSALRINILSLMVSVSVGLLGAIWLGPIGAALGSMSGLAVGEILALNVAADAMQTSPFDLIRWDIARRVAITAVSAGFLTHVANEALHLYAHPPIAALFFQGLIYSSCLLIAIPILGLRKEIEGLIGFRLKMVSRT